MGEVRVNVEVSNGSGGPVRQFDMVVDTGSSLATLPDSVLRQELKIEPTDEANFKMANGEVVTMPVGLASLTIEGITLPNRVVFGPDDMYLLGLVAIENAGLIPDTTNQRLIRMDFKW